MTIVSNDSTFWPLINFSMFLSYWKVAAGVVVVYDWVLTLGQEIELIWRQRRSLMTVLYLVVRYIGIPYSAISVLPQSKYTIGPADRCSIIMEYAQNGTNVVIAAMLGVIMIARLHAMYQGSTTMLIFLLIIFLALNIACVVITAIDLKYVVGEELILSGTYMCGYGMEGDEQLLFSMVWMLNTVWEVLALCLSVWVAVKHFRGLRRLGPSTRSTIGDSFIVLIQSHVFYFASFACVSCLQLAYISPELQRSTSIGAVTLYGAFPILLVLQMFVLGPRLILSVRGYHAKLVAASDTETSMMSIVFQERVHVSTSSTV
ncbi:uncharacterized protein HD556DRAFT_1449969 [Suillus plorans]|uniref:DUF6533 domain-containing protein n=1 Tax=Suillus plorans TaxID=116603 RepID=A0A9P7DBZ3_9AGAM|nr:uncharacterized protein HD556DRAFT_1449969 [Suillus plorans]KAG1786232.1 hypothetical protein HD556DRAFT_1449969 [Suillus plorans]